MPLQITDAIDLMALGTEELERQSKGRRHHTARSEEISEIANVAKTETVTAGRDLEKDLASVWSSINTNMLEGQAEIEGPTTAHAKTSANDLEKENVDDIIKATAEMSIGYAKQVNSTRGKISVVAWCFIVLIFAYAGIVLMKLNSYSSPTTVETLK